MKRRGFLGLLGLVVAAPATLVEIFKPKHWTQIFREAITRTRPIPMVWGSRGIGKTQIVKDVCRQEGWTFVERKMSCVEAADVRGIPSPDRPFLHLRESTKSARSSRGRGRRKISVRG
jgi:hypothetical protein